MLMNNVYPSVQEILPSVMMSIIPASLAQEIDKRYTELGPKYVTDTVHDDGRKVNGCMFKSSVQDALEEVVDAVFNVLVWMFKLENVTEPGNSSYNNAYSALRGLIELYSLLTVEKENSLALQNS